MTRQKAKKRTRQRQKRQPVGRAAGEHVLRQLPPLFEGKSQADVLSQLAELGTEYEGQFSTRLQRLQEQLLTIDPIRLLAGFSYYGLSTPAGNDPELTEERPILQQHVELMQALVLQYAHDSFEVDPLLSTDFENVRELIQDVSKLFVWRRFAVLDAAMSLEQRRRIAAQESMRTDTQTIRNWGYPQHIIRIVKDLFAPLEDDVEQTIGVRVGATVDMLLNVVQLIEDRINAHRRLLRPVLTARTQRGAVEAYYRAFPDLQDDGAELLRLLQRRNVSLARTKELIRSHGDLRLPQIFELTLDDLVHSYPGAIAPESIRAVAEACSLTFGELREQDPEFFFMDNPVWQKPLIQLGSDLFMLPIPNMTISFCLEIAERLIQPHPHLMARYEARRGKFLEEDVTRLFRAAFPHSQIFQGSQWHDPDSGRLYENDLLVQIDAHLVIVEAKSGKVTKPARRGAEVRLRKTIHDLVVAPAIQSKRFAQYLLDNPRAHHFATKSGSPNKVDTSDVRHVIRLSILLEPIGILQTRLSELQLAGFIPQNVELASTILLTDLELIFDLLERPFEKLHYLTRRCEFEQHADFLGDEPDLLALYLKTGLNIGEAEFDGTGLLFYGLSKTLDPYFMQAWYKQVAKKPRLILTPWWKAMLQTIEAKKFPRWIELSTMLLNVPLDNQKAFERQFKQLQRQVRNARQQDDCDNILVFKTGPAQRRAAIVGVAYHGFSTERRNALLGEAGACAMEHAEIGYAVLIGVDVASSHYPYSIIACRYRDQP